MLKLRILQFDESSPTVITNCARSILLGILNLPISIPYKEWHLTNILKHQVILLKMSFMFLILLCECLLQIFLKFLVYDHFELPTWDSSAKSTFSLSLKSPFNALNAKVMLARKSTRLNHDFSANWAFFFLSLEVSWENWRQRIFRNNFLCNGVYRTLFLANILNWLWILWFVFLDLALLFWRFLWACRLILSIANIVLIRINLWP